LDEIDRVRDTRGLASFIKSNSSSAFKFVLVGIAHDYSALLADHGSLQRVVYPCKVAQMRRIELKSIIKLVEAYLRDNGIEIQFDQDAKNALVACAAGFPWFVHAIGREALRRAFDDNRDTITPSDVEIAVKDLSKNSLARQFEDLYLRAVGNSTQREIVLRVFAKWSANDIPTSDIYPIAKALGVQNPSICTAHLTQERYGRILSKAPFATSLYSFCNGMFHHYVRLRPSVYRDVKSQVDARWSARQS
jgi:histone H3/H4